MSTSAHPTAPAAHDSQPRRPVWLVFARRRYDEPLYHVGTVTAENPDMASLFAESIYDEHPWIEMMVTRRSDTRTVIEA